MDVQQDFADSEIVRPDLIQQPVSLRVARRWPKGYFSRTHRSLLAFPWRTIRWTDSIRTKMQRILNASPVLERQGKNDPVKDTHPDINDWRLHSLILAYLYQNLSLSATSLVCSDTEATVSCPFVCINRVVQLLHAVATAAIRRSARNKENTDGKLWKFGFRTYFMAFGPRGSQMKRPFAGRKIKMLTGHESFCSLTKTKIKRYKFYKPN